MFYTNIQFPPVFHGKSFVTQVAGNPAFVEKNLAALHNTKRVIASIELESWQGPRARETDWKKGLQILHKYDLRSFKLRDSKCGGATDAVFLFGLGSGPGLECFLTRKTQSKDWSAIFWTAEQKPEQILRWLTW